MCIAIYKPEGKVLSKATLQECYSSNPDGAGFMYAHNKRLHIEKGFFSFDSFYKAYKQHETKQAVIHFRIKTHGKIDTTNCHPFAVNTTLGFVHNGIINGFGDANHSDTIGFNHGILQPLVNKWGNLALFQDPIIDLIEGRIGYSKLVFLDRHGNHKIMNEGKGVWDDGVWYSNNSYKPYVAPATTSWKTSDWINDYKYPVATVKTKTKTSVKVGDMVELLEDIADQGTLTVHETGELCEVVAVNQDFTCDLMKDSDDEKDGPKFIYNVPFHSLEFVDDFTLNDEDYLDYPVDPVGVPAYHKYASPSLLKRK
jgi:glutamine amidotransferase